MIDWPLKEFVLKCVLRIATDARTDSRKRLELCYILLDAFVVAKEQFDKPQHILRDPGELPTQLEKFSVTDALRSDAKKLLLHFLRTFQDNISSSTDSQLVDTVVRLIVRGFLLQQLHQASQSRSLSYKTQHISALTLQLRFTRSLSWNSKTQTDGIGKSSIVFLHSIT